jgi:hypothetical protein
MSATEKLLSNIKEYYHLLGFLNEKHPEVLKEWSNGPSNKATTGRTHQLAEDENYDG